MNRGHRIDRQPDMALGHRLRRPQTLHEQFDTDTTSTIAVVPRCRALLEAAIAGRLPETLVKDFLETVTSDDYVLVNNFAIHYIIQSLEVRNV